MPRRPIKAILGDSLLRLQATHSQTSLGPEDVEKLLQPVASLAGLPSGVVGGLVRLKDGLNRRSGARTEKAARRAYDAGYETIVTAVALALQHGRHTISTILDTSTGALFEATVATPVVGNPGTLCVEIIAGPTFTEIRCDAEFAGRFADGGAAAKLVGALIGDADAYLGRLAPGWQAMTLSNGEWQHRPMVAELVQEVDETIASAWKPVIKTASDVERVLHGGSGLGRITGWHKEYSHAFELAARYPQAVKALAVELLAKDFYTNRRPVPTGAADTSSGCRLAARLPGGFKFKEAHLLFEVHDEENKVRVDAWADMVSQRIGEHGPFILTEIESAVAARLQGEVAPFRDLPHGRSQ